MPPKASPDADNSNAVLILCQLMATCTEFKADTTTLATILGIAQSKNVPRKINSIINSHGYELRGGKVVSKDGDASTSATPITGAKKTPDSKRAPVTPTKPGKKNTTPKSSASKKRKIQEADEDPAADDQVKEDDD